MTKSSTHYILPLLKIRGDNYPDIGGLFVLFYFIFWFGLNLFINNLKVNYLLKTLLFIIISLWPYNLMILPHLWKDVGLISFVVLAIGFIQLHLNTGKKQPLFVALILLILASLFRFESIIYIAIIEIYTIILLLKGYHQKRNFTLKTIGCSLSIIVFTLLISQSIIKLTGTKKIILWQTVALWDLSRVSVKVNHILLPDFCIGSNMSVDDLSNATVPWTNTQLFWKTKSGMNSGLIVPYKKQEYMILFNKWISMINNYPREYLTHRMEVANDLLRINESSNKPIDLYFSRKIHSFNESFELNDSNLNKKITDVIKSSLNTILFKGWVYFVFEFIIFIYVFLKRKAIEFEFVLVLSLSGILSVIVLTFVSPSAEQRYLIWLFNSTLLLPPLLIEKFLAKEKTGIRTQ